MYKIEDKDIDLLKQFLDSEKQAIDENRWQDVFKSWYDVTDKHWAANGGTKTDNSLLTYFLMKANINFLNHMYTIPSSCFSHLDTLPDTFTVPHNIMHIKEFAFDKVNSEKIIVKSVYTISSYAFAECDNLKFVYLPKCLFEMHSSAFIACPNLNHIYYEGKKKEWSKVKLAPDWFVKGDAGHELTVHCLDGDIEI